jgi:hypothetical protein
MVWMVGPVWMGLLVSMVVAVNEAAKTPLDFVATVIVRTLGLEGLALAVLLVGQAVDLVTAAAQAVMEPLVWVSRLRALQKALTAQAEVLAAQAVALTAAVRAAWVRPASLAPLVMPVSKPVASTRWSIRSLQAQSASLAEPVAAALVAAAAAAAAEGCAVTTLAALPVAAAAAAAEEPAVVQGPAAGPRWRFW